MKIDMSSEAITKRLQVVNLLRRTCLSLAQSSIGEEIRKKNPANETVQRTSKAIGNSSLQ